jgi:membrane fusion protein (multidrug efflux system)
MSKYCQILPNRVGGLLLSVALVILAGCGNSADPAGGAPGKPGAAGTAGARASNGPVSVVARPVKATEFAYETEALGTSKANESVDVTAKVTNRVVAFHFREGEQLQKGSVMVEFDGTEARASVAAAEAALNDATRQWKRSQELFQSKMLSAASLEQLEATRLTTQAQLDAARARLDDTVIRAPFSGHVGLRNVSVGSLVTPGQVITTLDDTSVIKLDFTIPETFIAALAAGQQIAANSATYPDATFRGRIATIGTRVDPVSRSVVVRALIGNQDQRLKPGMFLTVHITRAAGKALMIPEQSLVPESSRQYVYVIRDGKANKVEITIGRRRPGEVEVLKNLNVGDMVVVEGGEKLKNGAAVTVMVEGGNDAATAAR